MISTKFDIAVASVPVPLSLLTTLVRRDTVGVLYHCISDETIPHVTGIIPVKSTSQFESDLVALKRCCNPVSYEEVVAHREQGKPLPPRAVMLTVDDGFSNFYTVMRPLLKKHGVPAAFFVITDTIDNKTMAETHIKGLCNYAMAAQGRRIGETLEQVHERIPEAPARLKDFRHWFDDLTFHQSPHLNAFCAILGVDVRSYLRDSRPYVTADEIRRMSDEGFTIGAHSKSHRELWLLDEAEELDQEIAQSCAAICELTGKASAPFSFPYQSNRIPRALLAQMRARHPQVGLMFDSHGFRKDAPFVVSRQCFDDPIGAAAGGSNVCAAMRHAYMSQVFWALLGRGAIK